MLNSDLVIAFTFMALLFLRQIAILKQPNKINYAPLTIAVGAIASLVHFILHPETQDVVLLIRESIFPFLIALFLYMVMNILHQTQLSENARTEEEFVNAVVSEITELKEFMLEMEIKMNISQEAEHNSQEEIRAKFREDIKILDSIKFNQIKFLDKFDEMEEWHNGVARGFSNFTEKQLPELDNIVHKHIDILRIAEQDHYNKLSLLLQKAVESRVDMQDDIEELHEKLRGIQTLSEDIAQAIIHQTLQELSGVTKSFEVDMLSLKSHTQILSTSLQEDEKRLEAIRKQSEIIIEQMLLSSNKMQELELQSSNLSDVYRVLQEIIKDVELVKSDYVKSHSQLTLLSEDLEHSKDKQIVDMSQKLESLSDNFAQKIDDSLEKLQQHYAKAGEEITQSAQLLAKRVQVKNGYSEYDH